jgi:MFS family permease
MRLFRAIAAYSPLQRHGRPARIDGDIDHSLARVAVSTCFLLQGLLIGVWASRIPTVKVRLGLDDAALGLAILASPLGTMLGLVPARILIDRFGSARVIRYGATAHSLSILLLAAAWNFVTLTSALFVFGFAAVLADVATNTGAVHVERAYRRSLMTSFHAAYSIGGMFGAAFGGLCAGLGVGLMLTFSAVAVPAAALALLTGRWLSVPPQSARMDPTPEPGHRTNGTTKPTSPSNLRVWLLGLLVFGSLFGEGAAENWSAVYLHEEVGASAGLAAYGFAAYSAAMIIGRLIGDRLSDRFGPARLVRICGLLAAVGLGVALATRDLAGALLGFGVMGLGLSCIVPQVLATAGHLDLSRAASGIARVSGLGFLGLLVSPAVIGAIAGRFGLTIALWLPVLLALAVAASARLVDRPATSVSTLRPSHDRTQP